MTDGELKKSVDKSGNCEVSGCAEVIAEVWTLLDGECSPESSARLRHHLEECPGCLQHYGIEEQIKTLVARKCGGEKAPDGLRERLKLKISQDHCYPAAGRELLASCWDACRGWRRCACGCASYDHAWPWESP
ncbi:mycothiol system anti-sigma-R factor [Mycobacteroides abscessus subsp. abscessus]|nr:mycothiol system anti-sigma-R factor [Mycobacteroides abscessus subsp. abscessus]